jgi:hypothetical protein
MDCNEFPRLEVIRERRVKASPSPISYHGPSAAVPDRPTNRKLMSYDQPKCSIGVAARPTFGDRTLTRRLLEPSPVERYEAEAEAYQRRRGSSDTRDLCSHHLTAEALRKVLKARALDSRSETNSSSSKGSSGANIGQSNVDITMRINGIAVGIPADSGQRITIQSIGVNISVGGKGRTSDKEYGSSRNRRAPSVASGTSRTSSSREKEKRVDRNDGERVVRDDEMQTLDRAGRTSQRILHQSLSSAHELTIAVRGSRGETDSTSGKLGMLARGRSRSGRGGRGQAAWWIVDRKTATGDASAASGRTWARTNI